MHIQLTLEYSMWNRVHTYQKARGGGTEGQLQDQQCFTSYTVC